MPDTITLAIEKVSRTYSTPTISLFGYDKDGHPNLIGVSHCAEDIADSFRFEASENRFAGLEIRVNGTPVKIFN